MTPAELSDRLWDFAARVGKVVDALPAMPHLGICRAGRVVTQQGLCYGLSGLPSKIEKSLVDKYKRGSKPDGLATEAEYLALQALSISLIDELEKDLEAGIFKQYTPFMTSLRVEIDSIEKAVTFNAYHEGLHLGAMLALQKLVAEQ